MRPVKRLVSPASCTFFLSIITSAMNYGLAYRQAHEMQQVLYQIVMDDKATPSVKASCARVWTLLQDTRRVIRGKPLPGHLRPELEQKRKAKNRPSALFATPLEGATPITPEQEMKWASAPSPPVVAELPQPTPVPVAAGPPKPATCSPCRGTGTMRFRGGYNVQCPTCGGTGRRAETSTCNQPD